MYSALFAASNLVITNFILWLTYIEPDDQMCYLTHDEYEDEGYEWSWDCGCECYENGYCNQCDEWWYNSAYDTSYECTPGDYNGYYLEDGGNTTTVTHTQDCPTPVFEAHCETSSDSQTLLKTRDLLAHYTLRANSSTNSTNSTSNDTAADTEPIYIEDETYWEDNADYFDNEDDKYIYPC